MLGKLLGVQGLRVRREEYFSKASLWFWIRREQSLDAAFAGFCFDLGSVQMVGVDVPVLESPFDWGRTERQDEVGIGLDPVVPLETVTTSEGRED